MKKLSILILTLSSLIFTSCISSEFASYYEPFYEATSFPKEYYLDAQHEQPSVIKTDDLETKYRELFSQGYICIGSSSFNSSDYDDDEMYYYINNLCKEKKAKIAIYSQKYTNTQSGSYAVPHTNYNTYTGADGFLHSIPITTYSTQYYAIDRYDYTCFLFVKMPEEYKAMYAPGITVRDLTQKDRETYKQNTGALIDSVIENSPAFYANLVHGDIVTNINGQIIRNAADFTEFQKKAFNGDKWNITIERNGNEKTVSLKYGI